MKSNLTELTAITPLDGRYRNKTEELSLLVSEYALIKTRFEIEAKYLIALSKAKIVRPLTKQEEKLLSSFYDRISLAEAENVKKIEEEVRHDVKSIERSFRNLVKGSSLENLVEMIHFGLTSEDINNLSYRLMLKRATQQITISYLENIVNELTVIIKKYRATPMLARTHGQSAVPTTLGKEIAVFALRLQKEISKLKKLPLTGKLNGAVGNFNALQVVFEKIDWITFSENFIKKLGLEPNLVTTQINPYDDVVEYLQTYQRINTILVDFNQDMWRYISDNWFTQIAKKGEVGSSTMPQKVNPIDFENSEGNIQIANSLIEGFARKLPISRLQRDLSDSTTIRNIGTILGYCLVGYKSILTGLSRVTPNEEQITQDLYADWSILTEGVQTILRKNNVSDPYSLIAGLTRGKKINKADWDTWVEKLPIENANKVALKKLSPSSYIGIAEKIADLTLKEIKKLR